MAPPTESAAKRPRISVDVQPRIRRRLRRAAAKQDLTIGRYVLQAIEEQNVRYTAQTAVEQAQSRKEAGRRRLIEMVADFNTNEKPRRRGFPLVLKSAAISMMNHS